MGNIVMMMVVIAIIVCVGIAAMMLAVCIWCFNYHGSGRARIDLANSDRGLQHAVDDILHVQHNEEAVAVSQTTDTSILPIAKAYVRIPVVRAVDQIVPLESNGCQSDSVLLNDMLDQFLEERV
jgi:hypothetical protein